MRLRLSITEVGESMSSKTPDLWSRTAAAPSAQCNRSSFISNLPGSSWKRFSANYMVRYIITELWRPEAKDTRKQEVSLPLPGLGERSLFDLFRFVSCSSELIDSCAPALCTSVTVGARLLGRSHKKPKIVHMYLWCVLSISKTTLRCVHRSSELFSNIIKDTRYKRSEVHLRLYVSYQFRISPHHAVSSKTSSTCNLTYLGSHNI